MSLLISILVAIIVIGVVFWAARTLIDAFKIPQPIASVILVVLVLLCLVMVIQFLGVSPELRLR